MNTKYTLEITVGKQPHTSYVTRSTICRSIRQAKQITETIEPTTAQIMNKRGEQIYAYRQSDGWRPTKPKKQSQTWLITVGYSIKKRKAIRAPYSQYNV